MIWTKPYGNDGITDEQVAWHESGHALAAVLHGRRFDYVTLQPEAKYKDLYKGYVYNRENLFKHEDAIISAAGIYTERLRFNRYHVNNGAQVDFENIDNIIVALYGRDNLTVIHKKIMDETDFMLRSNWAKLEKIVSALKEKKTLTYNEVKALL